MPRFHRLKVLRRLPHPGQGFTQGLLAEDGTVWESTGQYGQSTVRRYRLGFWRFACHFGQTSHVMKLRAIRVENNLDKTRKADEN